MTIGNILRGTLAFAAATAFGAVHADSSTNVFNGLLYGTQYYRAPTPLPSEWPSDLAAIAEANLNTIQIRINWRNNERVEDVYDFADVDRLLDEAESKGRTVIIKFLLECAPQYIFDKYHGTRIGHKGELIRGSSHGAFYSGGWLPCYSNPEVKNRMAKFVRTLVARYKDRKSIICWHAWNEPRTRPVGECYCDYCHKAFGEYLKNKFKTIEKLNSFYGVAEESFESIALPGMPHGYWDAYEFKHFKSSEAIFENLKCVRDAVRSVDATRPVIAHSGANPCIQWNIGDVVNDGFVSKAMDGWGSSVDAETKRCDPYKRVEQQRFNSYMRALNPNYFLHEIYPGLGMYSGEYDDVADMDYQLYTGLSNGSKGFCFWQYRSERLGMEADCAGLARIDGSRRPVLDSVREFGALLRDLGSELAGCESPAAPVAILFDFDSLLLGMVEDACQDLFEYHISDDNLQYYPKAHKWFFHALYNNDIHVDYLRSDNMQGICKYKVLYVPHYSMLKREVADKIGSFIRQGGTVIADEGFGLRQPNTWLNPYDIDCDFMKSRIIERRLQENEIDGIVPLKTTGYTTSYHLDGAKTLAKFISGDLKGEPAIQEIPVGRGRFVQLGFSLGFCAKDDQKSAYRLFAAIMKDVDIPKTAYGHVVKGLEERRLVQEDHQFIFLTNNTNTQREIKIHEPVDAFYGKGSFREGTASLPPFGSIILRCR